MSEDGTLQATYTYDANGNRATLTYANGVVESYQYNKANWITGLTNKKNNTTLSSYTYTYYASGSQKSETTNAGVVTGYTFDDLGRLTRESEANGLTLAYTYDANSNRRNEPPLPPCVAAVFAVYCYCNKPINTVH